MFGIQPATTIPSDKVLSGILLAIMLLFSSLGDFRQSSEQQLQDAANRALAAFAVARTINGVISVIQETEVGFSFGINTTTQPGQILDPLNDLIERFSVAALIAATLLWSLKILGQFLLAPQVPLLLILLLGICYGLRRMPGSEGMRLLLLRSFRIGMVVWIFAALTPWIISWVHHSDIIQQPYQAAAKELQSAGDQLSQVTGGKALMSLGKDGITNRIEQLTAMAGRLSTQTITVLGVFVFEVLLVPLGIFWITTRLFLTGIIPKGPDTAT